MGQSQASPPPAEALLVDALVLAEVLDGDEEAHEPPQRRTRAQAAAARSAVQIGRARRLGAAARGWVGSPPGVGRESASAGAGEGSLLARSLARCSNERFRSFSKPAMAHAEECGIAVSRYRQHLWSRGQALSQRLSVRVHELMTKLCCSASAGGSAPGNVRPTLFVRRRNYDETNSVLACHFDQGKVLLDDDDPLLDEEVGPTKVFVTESQFAIGVGLRQRRRRGSQGVGCALLLPRPAAGSGEELSRVLR